MVQIPSPQPKKKAVFRLLFSLVAIQAAGLAYHHRAKRGVYHQPLRGCISSRKACIPLRLDDIPPALIEKEKMIAFACDYDNTPLHINDEYAPTTHFGKLIALGAMSFTSVWAKYHEIDFFDEELLAGKSTKTERLKPVFENDILSGRATITDLVKRNNKNGLVEVSIDVHSQNGELVLKDITEAIMKCKNTIEN